MDVRIFTAFDGPDIEKQKLAIYEGMDIVIGTPKRLNRLFLISGIDVNQLKLFIVEDAEFLSKSQDFNKLIEVSNHISKCQFLVLASEFHPRLERLQELFMEHSELVVEGDKICQVFVKYVFYFPVFFPTSSFHSLPMADRYSE